MSNVATVEGFRVVAFSTAQRDLGHISFVKEANEWFPKQASTYGFTWESTTDWTKLNDNYLANVDLVMFLDTRPENAGQRQAFERYMNNGGAWLGFHFSAFALTPSDYPQNWPWYHNTFLGSGEYVSNTWKPTPAFLKNENQNHPVLSGLPGVFQSQANEWYRWSLKLVNNPDIEILCSIDPSSFPLGTKPPEIWYDGYHPVVWSNKKFKMIYMNMGHNDIDYDNGNAQASWSFRGENQNKLVINSMLWLAGKIK